MTKKTPKFEALITNAIRRLQAAQGSTASEIARYLSKEYDIGGPELRRQIQLTIRRGINYGILQRSKRGYVTCDHNIADVDPADLHECNTRRARSRVPARRRHRRGGGMGHSSRSRARKRSSRRGGRSRASRKRRMVRRGAIRHRRRRVMTAGRARGRVAATKSTRRVRNEAVAVKRRRRPSSATDRTNKMPQQEPPSSQRQQSGTSPGRRRTPSKSPTRSDEYQQQQQHQQQPQHRHNCHDHDDS